MAAYELAGEGRVRFQVLGRWLVGEVVIFHLLRAGGGAAVGHGGGMRIVSVV